MRRDTGEHALDVGGDRAITAQQPVPTQQPQLARLRDRVLRWWRDIVRIGPAFRLVGQQRVEFEFAKPGQRDVEPAKLQLAELEL